MRPRRGARLEPISRGDGGPQQDTAPALLLPEGFPHQQPDKDHDGHNDEHVYMGVRANHCRTSAYPSFIKPSGDWVGSVASPH